MVKQLLLTVLVLLFCLTIQAQNAATPNPGFENWTSTGLYWNPTGWNNLNSNTAIVGVFTCTRATAPADVHSGAYAIRLTTKSVFGITANGIASTATLITTPPYGVTGGINYTERPDSIVGWFKYNPASQADSGFVQFVLLGASNDTIGFVKFNTPNVPVSTYIRFSKAVTYFSSATPVKSYWILSSSDGVNPVVNSSIIIDDINLIFNSTGLPAAASENSVRIINSLVAENLFVENETSHEVYLVISDRTGRQVVKTAVVAGYNNFNVQYLSDGMYLYHIADGHGSLISYGKLMKM